MEEGERAEKKINKYSSNTTHNAPQENHHHFDGKYMLADYDDASAAAAAVTIANSIEDSRHGRNATIFQQNTSFRSFPYYCIHPYVHST